MANTHHIQLARELRQKQTEAEKLLWQKLRIMRCQGGKFRRQHPIGNYITDFCCLETLLVIELDGGHHNEESTIDNDAERTRWLEGQGYKVIRFWNNDVLTNVEGVISAIEELYTLTPVSPLKGEMIETGGI